MKTRCLYPDYLDFLSKYDIIGLQETKTDSLDDIRIQGYNLHFKHRKEISRIKSGGLAIAYKEKYSQYIKMIKSDSHLVMWFVISSRLTRKNDLLCGMVYIPPENSSFSSNDPYFEINEELRMFTETYSDVLLFGDFNSRIKTAKDYIDVDKSIFHANDLDIVCEELSKELSIFDDNSLAVRLERKSCDNLVNNYGYKLLDFCKQNSLFILNGRTNGDLEKGECTCKSRSCVDYFICTASLL